MKIIDMHMHTYPAKVAERAMSRLGLASGMVAVTDGTFEDTEQKMREWGIWGYAPLNIVTNPERQSAATEYSKSLIRENVFPFGSIHQDVEDIDAAAREIKNAGLYGIKLHCDYQYFFADDPVAYPIYEACIKYSLPVVFHAGYDPVSPDIIRASVDRIQRVALRYPALKVVAAHLGGECRWDEVETLLCGMDNVWFDTSMCDGIIDPAQMKRIILKHHPERVMFGSDCPWHSPVDEANLLMSLGLNDALYENIFHKNAEKLLKI